MPESGIGQRNSAVLAGILVLAALFRLHDVQQPLIDAFSWRQASTAMMADNFLARSWNIFFPEVSWTGPGPAYQGRELQIISYITALLYALFGWHDWLGRLVAIGLRSLGRFCPAPFDQSRVGHGARSRRCLSAGDHARRGFHRPVVSARPGDAVARPHRCLALCRLSARRPPRSSCARGRDYDIWACWRSCLALP